MARRHRSRVAAPVYAESLTVGSKRFTESYILGEILREAAARRVPRPSTSRASATPASCSRRCKAGAIDLYPEYTGTIAREILKLDGSPPVAELNRRLAPLGFGVGVPLGFNNSYALAMRDEQRASARHPDARPISRGIRS